MNKTLFTPLAHSETVDGWRIVEMSQHVRSSEDQIASLEARIQRYRDRVWKLEDKVRTLEDALANGYMDPVDE